MSGAERLKHATFAIAGFIPVVGWAGRAAKGGKAIHSTAKGMKAVDNSLSAYQYGKSLDVLRKTEYGIYGLASANGFGEYITGKDMFGNELSEEKRNQSLTESLFILGVSGMGMYADRLIDKNAVYAKSPTGESSSIDFGTLFNKHELAFETQGFSGNNLLFKKINDISNQGSDTIIMSSKKHNSSRSINTVENAQNWGTRHL